ncbi:hypothetical protein A6A04_14785 [Paramagnetospirillum marisnigri]|uniref:Uncharacterized protein n=1 Tax=Paramagnetospirillum marisnigri TaxID=1285242 RepID=A0A178MTH5_9PROT|nr:hypothetical protein A6A04_14785 [Paramagnetospirillum marisnigri]
MFPALLWDRAFAATGTLVETYLRSRAITIPIPASLRFLRHCPHNQTNTAHPAMIAAVTVGLSDKVVAVHRTYIAANGVGKASITPAKMTLGPIARGAIRLGDVGDRLILAEGIETALSVMQATGDPAWACISAGGLESVVLPPLPFAQQVFIAADNDANGVGQRAASNCADRLAHEGRAVQIAMPPKPDTDFNDLLMEAH